MISNAARARASFVSVFPNASSGLAICMRDLCTSAGEERDRHLGGYPCDELCSVVYRFLCCDWRDRGGSNHQGASKRWADRLGPRERGEPVSMFSSVDASEDPTRAISYLDQTRRAQSGMKHYANAAHAMRAPNGFVLDVGCGVGHDLGLLAAASMAPVGVDPSAVLLAVARERGGGSYPLLQANGEALPFRDESIAGAQIERVLQHVAQPSVVLVEVVRCLRRGALLTVFEPNWAGFTVRSESGDERCGWLCAVRHPEVGGSLWDLIEAAGCTVLDRVEELSVWRSLDVLDGTIGLERSIAHAVEHGRVSEQKADDWLREQRARDARGRFYAMMPKVMIVATRR